MDLSTNAIVYCDNCRFRTFNTAKHKHKLDGHFVPGKMRNKIQINILIPDDNLYKIILMNVKEDNTNPCVIIIDTLINNKDKIQNYSGAYVRKENLETIKLNSINDTISHNF